MVQIDPSNANANGTTQPQSQSSHADAAAVAIGQVADAVDALGERSFDGPTERETSRFGSFIWTLTAGFALGGFKVGIRALHDNSFFVHLGTGRWILDHGAVPQVDSYSFTSNGKPFVAQSWLASVVYRLLQISVGPIGIRIVMGLVAAIITGSIFRLANHLVGERRRASGLSLCVFAVVAAMYSERPLAFGLLGLVGLVWIVEAPGSRIGRRPEIALPLVMWLWANTHGSMALGYVFLALHLVGRGLDGAWCWRRENAHERKLALGGLLSIAVLLVNPYGPTLLLFPIELMAKGGVLKDVVEWMSPDFHSPQGLAFGLWLVVSMSVLIRSRTTSRRDLVVVLPFVVLALWAMRNLAIATIIALPAVARASVPRRARNAAASQQSRQNFKLGGVIGIGVVVIGFVFAVQAAGEKQFNERGYSVEAYRFVKATLGTNTRLLTTDANAGWMIAAHPEQKIFMDDRYDMFPAAIVSDYVTIARLHPGWREVLDKYRIQTVMWPTSNALTQLLDVDGEHFRRVYRDKDWTVFRRL